MSRLHLTDRPAAVRGVVAVSALLLTGALVSTAAAAPAKSGGTTIALRAAPSHGKVLDGTGKYVFVHVTAAGKNVPCTGLCQSVWPLVKTTGKPQAGAGVDSSALGQTNQHQVTYHGHPLYYYALSKASTVDDASSFGGKWRLVKASGKLT
jgi:predicted lipoprotein with Yx(FWY)xxD motif